MLSLFFLLSLYMFTTVGAITVNIPEPDDMSTYEPINFDEEEKEIVLLKNKLNALSIQNKSIATAQRYSDYSIKWNYFLEQRLYELMPIVIILFLIFLVVQLWYILIKKKGPTFIKKSLATLPIVFISLVSLNSLTMFRWNLLIFVWWTTIPLFIIFGIIRLYYKLTKEKVPNYIRKVFIVLFIVLVSSVILYTVVRLVLNVIN